MSDYFSYFKQYASQIATIEIYSFSYGMFIVADLNECIQREMNNHNKLIANKAKNHAMSYSDNGTMKPVGLNQMKSVEFGQQIQTHRKKHE